MARTATGALDSQPERASGQPRERAGSLGWSWRLGRIFGIGIDVHVTFLLLIAWVLFSELSRGSGLARALDGLLLVLSVFAIVVLHELTHALTARRFGVRTRGITLLPIGGVASLERMPEKPREELLVAIAGPALNVALAAAIGAVVLAAGGTLALGEELVGTPFLVQLFWINVSLAAFNLLPAFPMDGGRVLRAALAMRLSYARATEIAARLGQGMAVLFALWGLFGNPMLLLIALFVWLGAQQESAQVRLRSALKGLAVEDAMITDFRSLAPGDPLSRATELILAGFQHDFPVLDGARVGGVLTREDVLKGLAEGGADQPLERFMRREFETVEPRQSLESALERLQRRGSAPLLVMDGERVVGLLTTENLGELMMFDKALRGQRAPKGNGRA